MLQEKKSLPIILVNSFTKFCIAGITVLVALACNDTATTTNEAVTETTQTETPPAPNLTAPAPEGETAPAKEEPVETPGLKAGTHPISLQWIGWNKPGKATVKPGDDGWYSISGSQKSADGDYVKIDGKIRRLSAKELEFDGSIETKVSSIFGGKPCIRKGAQRFFAKGNRTYWRLQQMENCEGGNLVDYVDIYPGTSSL
ncbi:MAG: hypothetical protein EOO03_03995 [Chitinophagaceae bacterium]|nr:MAG: hypothetical protein EOO03_03995 [Chitinophagaceae bacterium]